MKIKIIFAALAAALLGGSLVAPVSATESSLSDNASSIILPSDSGTFAIAEDDDSATFRMGRNLFFFGNNVFGKADTNGLLFSFGNKVSLKGKSDYAFIAGNSVTYNSETAKDLFVAGNIITISAPGKVGRDVFATGNQINVRDIDLPHDFAAGANQVTFHNVKIAGDVNLDVASVVFDGSVEIAGKLIVNSGADITGWGNVTYSELEKYENIDVEPTATEILVGKLISIASLFLAMVLAIALFPDIKQRVENQLSVAQFGKNLVIGLCVLVFIPILSIFLLMSFIGAPVGIILIALYSIMVYLSQGFSGLWLGKLILEKGFNFNANAFIEALFGIVIIVALSALPGVSALTWMLSTLLGLGLILQSVDPRSKINTETTASSQSAKTKTQKAKVVKTKSAKNKSPKESK